MQVYASTRARKHVHARTHTHPRFTFRAETSFRLRMAAYVETAVESHLNNIGATVLIFSSKSGPEVHFGLTTIFLLPCKDGG